jgi:hypothetical protein
MKKILYILMLVALTTGSLTACTEESVTPKTEDNGGTGTTNPDPIGK